MINEPSSIAISLVVPIYNEGELIDRLHDEIVRAIEKLLYAWQIVYVDDGSTDQSLEKLLAKQQVDPRVTVVQLSRNWGHQAALSAGLSVAEGAAVVLMDGDLQDPPHVIAQMIDQWQRGAKVVIAQRVSRAEKGLPRVAFTLFYKLFAYLADFPIPVNAGIFGLLDRQAVDAINGLSEANRYLPGLRAWVGFETAVVYYERAARAQGKPKQNLWRLLRYGLDAIFSFSYKPLRLSLLLGLLTAVGALACAIVVLYCRIAGIGMFGSPVVAGYTSTILSVLFIGGIQLICTGILGEYIGRIYDEVKLRPLFIINRIHTQAVNRTATVRERGQ